MALFSNKKEKNIVRRASYQTGLLAAQDLEAVEAEKARAQAGEESALTIFNRLGAPGTFDTPTTSSSMAPTDIYDTTGPLSKKSVAAQGLLSKFAKGGAESKYGTGAETMYDPRQGILDPTKYADAVGQSAQFRIQSRQTAEAEQLLKQEGPAWDMLYNSTIGKIYEGAAIQNRETLRNIRDNLSKGGSARRTAFAQAQELIQIEKSHQMRTQQTWEANLKLHEYIRSNADRVQDSNIKFLENLPELRQTYSETMKALTNMLTGQVVPGATGAINASANAQAAVAAKDGAFLEGLIQSGISAVIGAGIGYATESGSQPQGVDAGIENAFANNPDLFGSNISKAAQATQKKSLWQSAGMGALKGALGSR